MALPSAASATNIKKWIDTNRYHHTDFSLSGLASKVKASNTKIVVIIPAKEVATTIGAVIQETVRPLAIAGIVSSTVVIDAKSEDRTGEIAAKHGATVVQRGTVASELGPSQGKGDALWRALKVTDGDIVAFLDGDTGDPNPVHLLGILGPLLLDKDVHMVRGCFERPFRTPKGDIHANEGGRVTELTARPLLNLHFPQLAVFSQPLAGEFAGRRPLLEKLNFPVGYGVEIGTLIDAWKLVGMKGLAEVDLGTRQNAHKPLRDLPPMSFAIMQTVEKRRGNDVTGRIWLPWKTRHQDVSGVERPPLELSKSQPNEANTDCGYLHKKTWLFENQICGLPNFRDIAGYESSHLRRNLIFLNANPSDLTVEGKVKLQALGVRKIFDLRRAEGIKDQSVEDSNYERWVSSPLGPERIILPIFQDSDSKPEALAQRLTGYADIWKKETVNVYRSVLVESGDPLKRIHDHVSRTGHPWPTLINCTGAKDRTGIMVMVLMLLAGCSKEAVAKEYHLSDEGLRKECEADDTAQLVETTPFVDVGPMVVQRAAEARKEVMTDLVEIIERKWDAIEKLLREMDIPEEFLCKSKKTLSKYN